MKLRNLKHLLCAILTGGTMLFTSCEECNHEGDRSIASSLQVGDVVCSDGSVLSKEKFSSSKKEPVAIVYHVNRNPEIKAFPSGMSHRQPFPIVWVSNRKRQLLWKRKTVTRTPMPCTATRK